MRMCFISWKKLLTAVGSMEEYKYASIKFRFTGLNSMQKKKKKAHAEELNETERNSKE